MTEETELATLARPVEILTQEQRGWLMNALICVERARTRLQSAGVNDHVRYALGELGAAATELRDTLGCPERADAAPLASDRWDVMER